MSNHNSNLNKRFHLASDEALLSDTEVISAVGVTSQNGITPGIYSEVWKNPASIERLNDPINVALSTLIGKDLPPEIYSEVYRLRVDH